MVFGSVPAKPASIVEAKADLLKNQTAIDALKKLGIGVVDGQKASIVKAGQLVFSDSSSGTYMVSLSVDGLTSAKGVALLVYVPGELEPRVIRPRWRNGKLQADLPVPCEYNVVTNTV